DSEPWIPDTLRFLRSLTRPGMADFICLYANLQRWQLGPTPISDAGDWRQRSPQLVTPGRVSDRRERSVLGIHAVDPTAVASLKDSREGWAEKRISALKICRSKRRDRAAARIYPGVRYSRSDLGDDAHEGR